MPFPLSQDAITAMIITVSVFALLQLRRRAPVDVLFLGAMLALVVLGVLKPEAALAGFSANAPLTIAGLLVVAAGLQNTGVIDWLGRKMLGAASTESAALRRLAVSLVIVSAFLLNTALVVMAMPFVADWCRRRNVSPSKLMIPVSYLTMLGGVCTLVGTSTTLIVNQILEDHQKLDPTISPLGLFDITWVGVPVAIVGTVFLVLFGSKLLPNRTDLLERFGDERREYLVELLVQPECSLNGQTVEQAQLRHLPGLYLIEIIRDRDTSITPVAPNHMILAGDRLIFTGILSTIVDLEKIPGLVPIEEVHVPQSTRRMAEAVLSRSSPLIGVPVRDSNFRQRYDAAIIAVHRNGERVTSKVGDIVLEPGDTLLLQTRSNFVQEHRNNPAFYLVSGVEGYSPRRANKAWIAAGLALILLAWLILGNTSAFKHFEVLNSTSIAALSIALAMVLTRCVSVTDARSA
ncbi:MAG: SLC13 family permease, partial [Planctomycetales bacterium]|nr:SLC13 family permease [Planctomycetales bacterium]